ncbi:GIY-YIG nuclease family protein [Streptomyces albireticuli]|uniref:GIY-YIG domain-containing protein n=1 Tax=Streptomyces albireticuli TaxID=1940 RepID=A0A2A2D544_9ACTN|nr:GIY-YIG nuclease family protein [Streptomyces albireticuli]MCD9196042.1 GIY-YIG nuclease family protein [Streptomyces albireticuli]PAU46566.1 hypothetical protein CK936_23525 [Streptomyces albireticuli]
MSIQTGAGRTALYRLYGADKRLLYVGISHDPESRFKRHRRKKPWWHEVDGISIHWYDARHKAGVAEANAIATENPRYNVQGTAAYREQVRATSMAISPEKIRNRGVGLRARTLQMRTLRDLLEQGVPEAEAREQAKLARERYVEAHRMP